MNTEPSRLISLITAAVTLTVNLLALIFGWAAEVVIAMNGVIAAWIAVAGEIIRSKVTPNANVALTKADESALLQAGYTRGKRRLNPEGDLDGR